MNEFNKWVTIVIWAFAAGWICLALGWAVNGELFFSAMSVLMALMNAAIALHSRGWK